MAKEDNLYMIEKMVVELRRNYHNFDIMTDEEFYYSPYGARRRSKGPRNENIIYFHCLFPGQTLNLISGYFSKGQIRFPMALGYGRFPTSVDVVYKFQKNRFWEAFIVRNDDEELYEDALTFMKEFLK